jgi:hypothetical protein
MSACSSHIWRDSIGDFPWHSLLDYGTAKNRRHSVENTIYSTIIASSNALVVTTNNTSNLELMGIAVTKAAKHTPSPHAILGLAKLHKFLPNTILDTMRSSRLPEFATNSILVPENTMWVPSPF